jgi:hypothetical protein
MAGLGYNNWRAFTCKTPPGGNSSTRYYNTYKMVEAGKYTVIDPFLSLTESNLLVAYYLSQTMYTLPEDSKKDS